MFVTTYLPFPSEAILGTIDEPWSCAGIQGLTWRLRLSTGVLSEIWLTDISAAMVPRGGGWGDVRSATERTPELPIAVTNASPVNVGGPEGALAEEQPNNAIAISAGSAPIGRCVSGKGGKDGQLRSVLVVGCPH